MLISPTPGRKADIGNRKIYGAQTPLTAHQTFLDTTALDTAIHDAVRNLNRERMPDPLAKPRISA